VATFAICANRDDWMPDSEQNYLPVSFVLRPSRVLFWAAALLLYNAIRPTGRRNTRQELHAQGSR